MVVIMQGIGEEVAGFELGDRRMFSSKTIDLQLQIAL